jgi:hypothetical protein
MKRGKMPLMLLEHFKRSLRRKRRRRIPSSLMRKRRKRN